MPSPLSKLLLCFSLKFSTLTCMKKIILSILLGIFVISSSPYAQPTTKNTSLQDRKISAVKEKEVESISNEMKHMNSTWFQSMNKPNADYFAVKKAFDKYFKKHKWQEGQCRERGEGWLKT